MKNIRNYHASKYNTPEYEQIEENIYKTTYTEKNKYNGIRDASLLKELEEITEWTKDNEISTPGSIMYKTTYNGNIYYKKITDKEIFGKKEFYYSLPSPREIYVTSLVFEQEPEYNENDPSSNIISQYPLEDILDKYNCFCFDFYEKENQEDKTNSYQEFASDDIEDIRNLRTIIGKHVYNNDQNELIIE